MVQFKSDPTHTNSNSKTGIRSNFSNQVSQWFLGIVLIGTFVFVVSRSFTAFLIWHGVWWFVISVFALSMRYYVNKETDLKLTEDADTDNWFMRLSLWPFLLLHIMFGEDWKEGRNRFVQWRSKQYIFRKEGTDPVELATNNPFLIWWVSWFRSADQYDVQAVVLDTEVRDRETKDVLELHPLNPVEKKTLTEFKEKVDKCVLLERNMMQDDYIKNPDLFVDYFRATYWDNRPINEDMKKYLLRQHALEYAPNQVLK